MSVRLTSNWNVFALAKLLNQSTLESASWLGPVMTEAVHICKVNA
eukprot:COSAG04_NODE_2652_length_3786_cov_3.362625_1_plen_44_part_10